VSDKLGSGAFGVVWKAKLDDKQVAIKELTINRTTLASIEREITTLSFLSNSNVSVVSRFYDVLCDELNRTKIYIAMEYVVGKTLDFDIQHKVFFTDHQLFEIITKVQKAVKCLHTFEVAHRDIKGQNVMYDGTQIKLIDFGLAFFNATYSDNLVGTPRSFAPEIYISTGFQRQRFIFWKKTDIWAVGTLGYELITHNIYPVAEWLFDARRAKCNMKEVVELEKVKPIVIPNHQHYRKTTACITKCLQFNTEERFVDWDE
jgi:serine/threonine protein kinase